MPDLGQVRHIGDNILIFLPRPSRGPIPILGGRWMPVCPHAIAGLDAVADGAVIDPEALLRRGEVVLVREAPMHIDDATFEALLREAEVMGGWDVEA